MTLTYAEFCAGYGGLGLAVEEVFNAKLRWYSEFEAAPSRIMEHHWPGIPNHGDMTTINFEEVEQVDILSGGTPCQDLSTAGRRAGMRAGTRSGLWESMREAIAIIKPKYVVWENVRGAYSAGADSAVEQCAGCMGSAGDRGASLRALGRVLGDLSDLGYDCSWRGLRAADVGAPHGRFRVFILATKRVTTDDSSSSRRDQTLEHDGGCPTCGHRPSLPNQPDSDALWAGSERETTSDSHHLGSDRRWKWPEQDRRGQPADSGNATADAASARPRGREDGGTSGGDAETQRGRGSEPQRDGSERTGTTTSNPDSRNDAGREQDQERGEEWGTTTQRGSGSRGGREALADAASNGRHEGRAEPARIQRGHDAAERSASDLDWGPYTPAIRRWEAVRGTAPAPTELTAKGKHRLSAKFAEWLMGVDPGWITDVPGISRNDMLKAAGNGVVPQQAAAALRDMLNQQENQ